MLPPGMKFCGTCGTLGTQLPSSFNFAQNGTNHLPHAPSFAPVANKHVAAPNPKLQTEAGKLMLLLARERIFLYFHWIVALSVQGVGFFIANKCYHEYMGDDMTRLVMSLTPLFS